VDQSGIIHCYPSLTTDDQRRYSPATGTFTDIHVLNGRPDPAYISASYVERRP
jgi:hypothetical protein